MVMLKVLIVYVISLILLALSVVFSMFDRAYELPLRPGWVLRTEAFLRKFRCFGFWGKTRWKIIQMTKSEKFWLAIDDRATPKELVELTKRIRWDDHDLYEILAERRDLPKKAQIIIARKGFHSALMALVKNPSICRRAQIKIACNTTSHPVRDLHNTLASRPYCCRAALAILACSSRTCVSDTAKYTLRKLNK